MESNRFEIDEGTSLEDFDAGQNQQEQLNTHSQGTTNRYSKPESAIKVKDESDLRQKQNTERKQIRTPGAK